MTDPSPEDIAMRERIQRIVEKGHGSYTCPKCGFNRTSPGGVHSYGGRYHMDRGLSKMCNGKIAFYVRKKKGDL